MCPPRSKDWWISNPSLTVPGVASCPSELCLPQYHGQPYQTCQPCYGREHPISTTGLCHKLPPLLEENIARVGAMDLCVANRTRLILRGLVME